MITELEKEIMIAITKDCFFENGLDSVIWTDCFLDDIKMDNKIARGVISSLKQKGFINASSGKDATISFTDKGKEYIIEKGIIEIEEVTKFEIL